MSELDRLIEKATELRLAGWKFEVYSYDKGGSGWFIKPTSDHWLLKTPQGGALPFCEAVKKAVRTMEYLGITTC